MVSATHVSSSANVPLARSLARSRLDKSALLLCPTPKMAPSSVASRPAESMSRNSRLTASRQPSWRASTPNTSSMSRKASRPTVPGPPAFSLSISHGAATSPAEASLIFSPSLTALRRKWAHAATYSAKPRTVPSRASLSMMTSRPCTLNFSLPSMATRSRVSLTATFSNRESTRSTYSSNTARSSPGMVGSARSEAAISSVISLLRKGLIILCVTASCTCVSPASAPT
mmetsp:Transcript_16052/g.62420  ORF Transcript_16052/g.62420 Transcript_16052/m.62420 type:complete len:229 (+) Transcript_16052:296-982(+)